MLPNSQTLPSRPVRAEAFDCFQPPSVKFYPTVSMYRVHLHYSELIRNMPARVIVIHTLHNSAKPTPHRSCHMHALPNQVDLFSQKAKSGHLSQKARSSAIAGGCLVLALEERAQCGRQLLGPKLHVLFCAFHQLL